VACGRGRGTRPRIAEQLRDEIFGHRRDGLDVAVEPDEHVAVLEPGRAASGIRICFQNLYASVLKL
jgi:hypothetical protein